MFPYSLFPVYIVPCFFSILNDMSKFKVFTVLVLVWLSKSCSQPYWIVRHRHRGDQYEGKRNVFFFWLWAGNRNGLIVFSDSAVILCWSVIIAAELFSTVKQTVPQTAVLIECHIRDLSSASDTLCSNVTSTLKKVMVVNDVYGFSAKFCMCQQFFKLPAAKSPTFKVWLILYSTK